MSQIGTLKFLAYLFLVFFFGFSITQAATISDGADAVGLIGQYQNLTDDPLQPNYTATNVNSGILGPIGFNSPSGIEIDSYNKRLFVSDFGNNRILVFNLNDDLTLQDKVADYVLGQPDFTSKSLNTTASGLYSPDKIAYASTTNYLYVADYQNHRVLVYDVATITNGEDAIYVLGQQDFTTRTIGTTATTMQWPSAVALDEVGDRLFVTDTFNHRVLIFDISTISNGESATYVLGQSDFTALAYTTTRNAVLTPRVLFYEYERSLLYVGNLNRISVFDVATTSNNEQAAYVLGQSFFTFMEEAVNQANRFAGNVTSISIDPIRRYLFVGHENRVSTFDVSTITNGESAINIIGVPTFTTSSSNITIGTSSIAAINGLAYASSTLYAGSVGYNRISLFDVSSISNGEGAVDLIGQYTDHNTSNLIVDYLKFGVDNGQPGSFGFNSPNNIALDKVRHRMFVSDVNNRRILVFNLNNDNTITNFEADYVLGQSNFASTTASTTQTGLSQPRALEYDEVADRLFVADYSNHRVLVYDTATLVNGEPALAVLGQSGFTTASPSVTQAGMNGPYSLAYSTTTGMLYVGQFNTGRITVYSIGDGITNGENAVAVLGQANFTASQSVSVGASTTANVFGLAVDNVNNRLFAVDGSKNRVLVFDVSSVSNGEDAVSVLGQTSFTTSTTTATQNGLYGPTGVEYDQKSSRLFVTDSSNARIVVYNVATATSGEKAINVLGQNNFTSWFGGSSIILVQLLQSTVKLPTDVVYDSDNELLYVSQMASGGGNRISIFNAGPDTTAPTLTAATTSTDGTNIYITYNEPLDENSLPTTTDFIISVNGATSSPTAVSISGATVILTISSTIYSTDTLTLTYTAGTYPVTDYSGNLAHNISASAVTNLSTQTDPNTPVSETPSRRRGGGGSRISPPATSTVQLPTPIAIPTTPSTPQTGAGTTYTRDLSFGSTGTDVIALQRFLNSRGFTVSTTGPGSPGNEINVFGSRTQAALARFQTSVGITPASGYFGPITRSFVNALGTPVQTPTVSTPTPPTTPTAPQTTTSPSNNTTTYTRDLFLGSRGSDVTALQNFLIQQGYLESGYATGYFGQLTQSALIKFQQAKGVNPALGYFGPRTKVVVGK